MPLLPDTGRGGKGKCNMSKTKNVIPFEIGSIADLKTQLRGLFKAPRVPVMLWGPTGVGKTAAVDQLAEEFNVGLLKFHLLWRDLVDLKGVPVPDYERRVTDWFRPTCFPGTGDPQEGILFLDEINTAPPAVQALAYQMVQEGRVGDYQLPPGWRRWAAGNNMGDRGVTYNMPDPLLTRMVHLNVEPDSTFFSGRKNENGQEIHGGWRSWAITNGVHPLVMAYLEWGIQNNADSQSPFAPFWEPPLEPGAKGFPSPRTWGTLTSDILWAFDGNPEAAAPSICGAVGQKRGLEFLAFCELRHLIPSAEEIIAGVDHPAPPADRPDLILLTMNGLIAQLRALAKNKQAAGVSNFLRYIEKFSATEYQVTAVCDASRLGIPMGVFHSDPRFKKWAAANYDIVITQKGE